MSGSGFNLACFSYNEQLQRSEIAVFIATLGFAACLQWASGAYRNDFDGDPDEPAHVVSSLLVRDYLTGGLGQNPLTFARSYYVHFPKVAIGHWPPLFHATEALWMLVFGRSKRAMVAWLAVLCALLVSLIFALTSRATGRVMAGFAAAAFLASPLVQMSISSVMLDILLGVLAFSAAFAWGNFLESGKRPAAVWYVIFAIAAMATNGRGILVALLWIPTGAILARGVDRRWLAGFLAMCALLILPSLSGRAAVPKPTLAGLLGNLGRFIEANGAMLSWPVLALAGIGAVSIFRTRHRQRRWVPMLGLAMSALLFHTLAGWPLEDRYLLTSAPAVAVMAAVGLRDCLNLFASLRYAVPVLCMGAALFSDGAQYVRKPDLGYHRFADETLAQSHATSLIVGDALHEGSYIAEMDLRDQRPSHTILRGSKALAQSTWEGRSYRMLFRSPEEVSAWLDSTDITLVIVQPSGPPHVFQLLEAMGSDAAHWHELHAPAYLHSVRLFERVHV